jgi:hypothetical protein
MVAVCTWLYAVSRQISFHSVVAALCGLCCCRSSSRERQEGSRDRCGLVMRPAVAAAGLWQVVSALDESAARGNRAAAVAWYAEGAAHVVCIAHASGLCGVAIMCRRAGSRERGRDRHERSRDRQPDSRDRWDSRWGAHMTSATHLLHLQQQHFVEE